MAEDASSDLDEETIVLRMMDRDEDALRQLLQAYAPRTRAYLKRKYGQVLADPEIEEAMNVAAFNAFRFADRFDKHKGTLSTWFATIAIHAAQSVIRDETKHRHRDLDYDPEYNPAGCDDSPEPADKAESRRVADLREGLHTLLTPAEREIVLADLAAGEGDADDARLAEKTGRSKNTIHALRSKAQEAPGTHDQKRPLSRHAKGQAMTSDADRFWDEVADKLRKAKGFCVPAPKDLQIELDAIERDSLTDDEIDAMVQMAVSGELATWTPMPDLEWTEDGETNRIVDDVMQLNRNLGDDDPEIDELLDQQRREALGTDEDTGEDQD